MIKNIIFDIGGVLFSYRCKEMLMSYGLPDKEAKKVAALLFDDPLWAELDIAGRDREEAITTEYMEKYPDYAEAIHPSLPLSKPNQIKKSLILQGFPCFFCIFLI